jgi:hypothetical protein
VRIRFRSFCFGLILSVAGLWLDFLDHAKEKIVLFRDFIVDCVASAFNPLVNRQAVIPLTRAQVAMREYFNKLKSFGVAVWSVSGFTHKLAVNVNA